MTKREELSTMHFGGTLYRTAYDEPIFILCARDPLAAITVRRWAIAYLNLHGGLEIMSTAELAKFYAALQCADQMEQYYQKQQQQKAEAAHVAELPSPE